MRLKMKIIDNFFEWLWLKSNGVTKQEMQLLRIINDNPAVKLDELREKLCGTPKEIKNAK
jgi:hypothetical protein